MRLGDRVFVKWETVPDHRHLPKSYHRIGIVVQLPTQWWDKAYVIEFHGLDGQGSLKTGFYTEELVYCGYETQLIRDIETNELYFDDGTVQELD